MKLILFPALILFGTLIFGEEDTRADGHSIHGEVFNVGPRQAAVLIDGTGDVNFPVSTRSKEAQAFFNEGIGQLHGYWDFEAERSFRQASAIDPDCAMAYWGIAMANYKNADRGKGFIGEALKRIDGTNEKEKLWINSLAAWFDKSTGKDKERREAIADSIRKIVSKYPDDVEAKAFLYRWTYQNSRKGVPIPDFDAMTAISDQIFAKAPSHPTHHYVIHLWDRKKPANALESAALCGPSAPAIAHMWHMPGHIYSKLRRYREAAWYQEASARVDHAHMMKFHLLPDQIHNFAHNNEWLVRNLIYIGRGRDAVSLARNMIELPRLPKFSKEGDDKSYDPNKSSWKHGRKHLKDTLFQFEQWNELLALQDTPWLEPDGKTISRSELDKYIAIASFETGDIEAGRKILAKVKSDSNTHRELSIYDALNATPPDTEKAASLLPRLRSVPKIRHAWLWHRAGDNEKAVAMARDAVKTTPGQVIPLAIQVQILYSAGKLDEAEKSFKKLRTTACVADTDLPVFRPLAEIAAQLGFPEKWQTPASPKNDPGPHPDLESLGPFRWSPPIAPGFALHDFNGKEYRLTNRKGKA
ncbi:MAG: hypothetical protein P1V20_29170, partial [Verrucomicrobiales bacterium]|nr:hypothetical protein [Verrucomicrobiales bacterium]